MTSNACANENCAGIRLFVGLGNPGAEYERTRHNAGFWWVDAMARQFGANFSLDKNYKAFVAKAVLGGENIYFLKPLTFMNLSGQSVAPLARFFKIAPEEILIAHDELDIDPGLVKLKCGGGHAGHNGLRSIQAQLGSPDFWRLRLGIGHPGDKSEVASYVLRKPPLDEAIAIDRAMECSLGVANDFLAGAFEAAQRVLHSHRP